MQRKRRRGSQVSPETIEKLRNFKAQSKFKQAVLNMLVQVIDPAQVTALKEEFEALDLDQSGLIELSEL